MARRSRIACASARRPSSTCRRWTKWRAGIWWPTWWPSSARWTSFLARWTANAMNPALHDVLAFLQAWWVELVSGVVIVGVVPLVAGYLVLMERKLMADMQARLGPMRVGPHGLLQPIADAVKLLIKEDIIPDNADKMVFWLAPVVSMTAALTAMAAIAFGPAFQVARDINVGLLFIVGVSSLGLFGIVLGGWASNSHYSIMGALRSTAQLVSYETAAGLALVSGLLLAGTLRIHGIVDAQKSDGVWYIFLAPIAFF